MKRCLALLLVVATASACNPAYYVALKFVYRRADLPTAQVVHDISYDPVSGDPHRALDLFTPEGSGWPVVVFVHGGSWTEGDRALKVGGADIYANVGRFLASHGIGAAVISYRLIPAVDWRTQAGDVLKAVAWTYDTIAIYGGRRDQIFLMGHSSGSQVAMRVALESNRLTAAGVPASAIRGVIAVSGAGYDLADQTTYDLGHSPDFYAKRFRTQAGDINWQHDGSVTPLVTPWAPPTLVIFAGGDPAPLRRQSQVMFDALKGAGANATLTEVPGLSHTRILLSLSQEHREASSAALAFIAERTRLTP
ncbi:MAG: alpha/beta hydrolase [Acidobacteriota bacterium]